MDERFVCRKTYTNGKDDEVKELIFCLTVIRDGGKYRVVNLTDNTLWENIFESESAAIDAIKNGSWNVIQEKEPRTEYSFHQWNKRRQYELPMRLGYLANYHPNISWLQAQRLYYTAVDEVLKEANVEYIDEGNLSWGRGFEKARIKFEKLLEAMK